MLLEKPIVDLQAPLTLDDAQHALSTGLWGDDPALQMVIQDALRAENFEATKQWVMAWPTATALYQSPFTARFWEGTQVERANVPMFTVATCVNSLVPQIMSGLFYDNPPFMIQERPGTKSMAARAIGALLAYQFDDINFREEMRLGVNNAVLFGTGMWKWGWETFTRSRTMYHRNHAPETIPNPIEGKDALTIYNEEDIDFVEEEEYVDRPVFEHIVNLRQVLVDPGLNVPDIRKAKYVVHRMYVTINDLEKLRNRPGFDIPSQEKLLQLFFAPKEEAIPAVSENIAKNPMWDARSEARYEPTTVDPFNQPLEMLERWDEGKYIVVLQKKLVLCNTENPYGAIPFLSIGWWDVPEAFWSMGLAKTIGAEQRLQVGLTNLVLDQAALNLNGVFVRVRGKSIPTQNIRLAPGRIIEVDSQGDFQPLARVPAVPEAQQYLAMSQARAEQVSGANELNTQGIAGQSGHSNIARSSAGANLLAAGGSAKGTDFVEKLASQVILPFLYAAHELNRSLLPVSTMKYILGDVLQHEFMKSSGDTTLELLNAKVKFSILAAAKMQARRNMAQALPIMIQFLTNDQTTNQLAIAGFRVDVVEIMRMFFEVSDWKNFNDVVVQMTPQEKQQHMAMQPGVQAQQKQESQMKGQMQMQEQKKNNSSELIDQENIARAGREVLRHTLESAETPEALQGQPGGGQGFGNNV